MEAFKNITGSSWLIYAGIGVGCIIGLWLAMVIGVFLLRFLTRQRLALGMARLEVAKVEARRRQALGENGDGAARQVEEARKQALEMARVCADLRKQVDAQQQLLGLREKDLGDLKERFKRGAETYSTLERAHNQASTALAMRTDELDLVRGRNAEIEDMLRCAIDGRETSANIGERFDLLQTEHEQTTVAARMMESQLKRKIDEIEMLNATITDMNNQREVMRAKVEYMEMMISKAGFTSPRLDKEMAAHAPALLS